jgi:serine/threonine protein kinase
MECTDIKLADFGSSEEISPTYSGSFSYNCPERFLGYSLRYSDDIWAFGCTAVRLLTGVVPFRVTGNAPRIEQDLNRADRVELFSGQKLGREVKERSDLRIRRLLCSGDQGRQEGNAIGYSLEVPPALSEIRPSR